MKTILVFNVFEHIQVVDLNSTGTPLVLSNLNYSQQLPDFLTEEQALNGLTFIVNPNKAGFVILPVYKLVSEEEATKHELTLKLKDMKNQSMKRKLVYGKAIDISENDRVIFNGMGTFVKVDFDEPGHTFVALKEFVEGKDYCDSKKESWVWSIGKHLKTGKILASFSANLYQHPDFECLFLR